MANADEKLRATRDLEVERWLAHKEAHVVVEQSLRDYKRDANEWRATLADLRLTFIPKAEFQSEHRALAAQLHGEVAALAAVVNTLDQRVHANTTDIKTGNTEREARRSVFSDSRNVLAAAGLLFGLVASALLIADRLPN